MLSRWWQRTCRAAEDDSGQTLVLAALCFGVLVAFLGIAIDIGHLRYAKRHLQMAADAAALASGLELRTCGAANPCTVMANAGKSSLAENGFPGSTVVYNCATMPANALVLRLNTPPCALGASDPNSGKAGYLEVQIQQVTKTFFARVFGWKSVTLLARAEVQHAGAPCIYALDPTGAGAITVTAGLTATCGIVDESTNASAFSCSAGTVSVPQITIAGGSAGLLCSANPKPRTGAPLPNPADPLKYLAAPAMPACGTSLTQPYHGAATALVVTGTATLYPDKAYCGGLTIAAGANVTFMPGTYVVKSTGVTGTGLSISLLATVTGAGVTFYNYGPAGGLSMVGSGLTKVNLSAPTTGTYSGVLYFQDAANTTSGNVAATTTASNLQGALYLPSAQLSYTAASPGPYTLLVAKDLTFKAAVTLGSDYSSLATGSPANADNVQLVQ